MRVLRNRNTCDLIAQANDPFRHEKSRSQFIVVSRCSHRGGDGLVLNTNFERRFNRYLVVPVFKFPVRVASNDPPGSNSVRFHRFKPNDIIHPVEICHLYISTGHNFVGHHGREPDNFPMIEVPEAECVAGLGLRGDRYFDHKADYKGQITFFSLEVFDQLCGALQVEGADPGWVRRNVFTRGIDLNTLIGNDFQVQGIRFHGTEESRPCYWMNRAIGPGAQEFLRGNGGLRARILSDGVLRSALVAGHSERNEGSSPRSLRHA